MNKKKPLIEAAKLIHSKLQETTSCYEITKIVKAKYIICDENEGSQNIASKLSDAIFSKHNIHPEIIKISGDVLSIGLYSLRKEAFLPVILNKTIEKINNKGQKIIIANRFIVDKLQGDSSCHFCNIDDFRTYTLLDQIKTKEASWGSFSIPNTAKIVILRPDIESILTAVYLYHETGGTAQIMYLKSRSDYDFAVKYSCYHQVLNLCLSLGVRNITFVPVDDWKDFSDNWHSIIYVVPQSLSLPFSYCKSNENRKSYVVKQDFETVLQENRCKFLADIDELAILGSSLFKQGILTDKKLHQAISNWFGFYKAKLFKEHPMADAFLRMVKYRKLRKEFTHIIAKHKQIIEKKYYSK